jgi:type IV secretion system protein VirB10
MTDGVTLPPPANDAPAGSIAPPGAALPGERHVSEVAGRGPMLSKRSGMGLILGATALACGFVVLRAANAEPGVKVANTRPVEVKQVAQYEGPPTLPAPVEEMPVLPMDTAPPLPEQPYDVGAAGIAGASQPAPAQQAQHEPQQRPQQTLLVYSAGNGAAGAVQAAAALGQASSPGGELGSRLQPTQLSGVSANLLRNQSYLLTAGTMIPCVLQTAMDSTLPGLVTCIVPQDVMGKSGVTLFDRGTRIVGEFQGGVRQGQARLFVLWTRAETPQGVVISLASPGTDPLGRSGLPGAVDSRFWQRFGGALLLSTVSGAIQAGVAAASKSGTTTINTGTPETVIAETLRDTIQTPPLIRKAQGELVSVMVARDLDFSTVYAVQATASGSGGGGQ